MKLIILTIARKLYRMIEKPINEGWKLNVFNQPFLKEQHLIFNIGSHSNIL